jgi:outer membrane receptor protein involved in Fe transport
VLVSNSFLSGFTANTIYIPATTVAGTVSGRAADPAGFSFFAPSTLPTGVNPLSVINAIAPGTNVTGLTTAQLSSLALGLLQRNRPTPYEYAAVNPGINPLLFVGTFGPGANSGLYPTVLNSDPATQALFPRIAVPLQFDRTGTLVPFNIGNIMPPLQGRLGGTFGSDGYDSFAEGHQQIRSAVQRANIFVQSRFDFTDNIRTKGEYFYTDITFDSVGGAQGNSATGSTTAGTRSIPIFINQNPYLNAASKTTLTNLRTQGWTPTVICSNGAERTTAALCPAGTTAQDVFYMGRALAELTDGGTDTGNDVKTWRVMQALEGEFNTIGRQFYWELSAGYGRAEAINRAEQLLDIEFALAIDVVTNSAGQAVCRQQTLAAPESIALRNPQVASINTLLSLTPTAAQVAACKPLNLFGVGAPSREAIDYVKTDGGTTNVNTQTFYAGNIGTDLFELPGGQVNINLQAERRKETAEFLPGASAAVGAARNTTIRQNTGSLQFDEYGAEMLIPVFGGDFSFPLLRAVEINGAVRRVERSGTTTSPFFPVAAPPTKDDTYTVGVRWKPFDDLTLRYNLSTSVRSASVVELFSAPGSGFSNFNGNVCANTSIDSGPNPTVRRRNCIEAVKKLGLAADNAAATAFLASFTGTGGSRPAASTGNPFLVNEVGDAYSAGFTYEPSWLENFTVSADYVKLDITNEVGLLSPALYIPNCFDSDQFPNTVVNGTPVCDLFTFGVQSGGAFIIPTTNPLTGNPVAGGAPIGTSALIQGAFETAYFQFPNFNQGARKLRSTNLNAFYRFGLDDLIGERAKTWGDIGLRANVYWAKVLDLYANGVTLSGRSVGSGLPEYQVRLDLSHQAGRFSHTLQYIWVDSVVGDMFIDPATYSEQSPTFVQPAYSYMNYYAAYEVSDKLRVRLSISNLTDTDGPFGEFGSAYDSGIGREYTLGVNYRF